jgi:hypothetical protein
MGLIIKINEFGPVNHQMYEFFNSLYTFWNPLKFCTTKLSVEESSYLEEGHILFTQQYVSNLRTNFAAWQ